MGQNTEEKLKMESDIFALKRDYKYALENLTALKKETVEILTAKEKADKECVEKQEELTKILNQISQEKLDWSLHRGAELQEIEQKNSEVDNVLKRKSELNVQEEEIRKLTQKNTDILNENRRLEIKLKDDALLLGVKEREIEEVRKTLNSQREKELEEMKTFKSNVLKILSLAEKL